MLINYLNTLKNKGNFTYETISNLSGIPEATIKNIFSGKTEDPRFETVSAIVKAMGGSLNAIYSPEEKEENSVGTVKDVYEQRIKELKEHYENRISDIKEHYENRIVEIDEHIATIQYDKKWFRIAACVFAVALITLFTVDLLAPNVGWFRY